MIFDEHTVSDEVPFNTAIPTSNLLCLSSAVMDELVKHRTYSIDSASDTITFQIKNSKTGDSLCDATTDDGNAVSEKPHRMTYVDIREALRSVGFGDIADASDDEVSAFVVSLIKEGR
jgi:hypothetical protein